MTTQELAEALEAWAVAALPALQGSYDHQTAEKTQPLPDVAIEVRTVETTSSFPDPSLESRFAFEQVVMKVWTVSLLLMVPPEPGEAASEQLTGFIDTLQGGIMDDGSLGGRVSWCSKDSRASFTPPFVQFDDGTRGRVATLELTVGEPIPYEE